MTAAEELKKNAARAACEAVRSGMVLGLGTGSTTHHALVRLGELLREGRLKDIVGIPSSLATEKTARGLGIPLGDLEAHPEIDLTIDGADEVDPEQIIVHDVDGRPSLPFSLAHLSSGPTEPTCIGVFRKFERPVYGEAVRDQLRRAEERLGKGDLRALLHGGDTWTVA